MPEMTLEALTHRLTSLEDRVAEIAPPKRAKDWRRTVGMFEGSEFMAQVEADILAEREAEREEARAGNGE